MSNKTPIVVSPPGAEFRISVSVASAAERDAELATASKIIQVTSADQEKLAIVQAGTLKGIAKTVTEFAKMLADPFHKTHKALLAKGVEFNAGILPEITRLERLVAGYQTKLREEEAARIAEVARVQREAEEAARQAQKLLDDAEKERARLAEIAAGEGKAAEEAKIKLDDAMMAAEAAQFDAMMAAETVAEASAVVIVAETPKAKGVAMKEAITFEVLDIEEFYLWDSTRRMEAADKGRELPSFVKLEVKTGDFKTFLSSIPEPDRLKIPGVRVTSELKAETRVIQTKTIQ